MKQIIALWILCATWCVQAAAPIGTNISRYPNTNVAPASSLLLLAVTNEVPATNYNILITDFLRQATNTAVITNWTILAQPASSNLTNWSLIPTGAMANVVSVTYITNAINNISNYINASGLLSLHTNGVIVTSLMTNLNLLYGTGMVVRTTNASGSVAVQVSAEVTQAGASVIASNAAKGLMVWTNTGTRIQTIAYDTNFWFHDNGNYAKGRAVDWWFGDPGTNYGYLLFHNLLSGESGTPVFHIETLDDAFGTPTNNTYLDVSQNNQAKTAALALYAGTVDTGNSSKLDVKVSPSDVFSNLIISNVTRVKLNPTVSGAPGSVAYIFDTANQLSIGNTKMVSLRIAGIERAFISEDGTYETLGNLVALGNLRVSGTSLLGGLVVTQDIRFLGHNSASNSVWVCTNATTGEGEWRAVNALVAFTLGLTNDPDRLILQGSANKGALYYSGTNAYPNTNGGRSGFEFYAPNQALRFGEVAGGNNTYGLGSSSNYWDTTNVGFGTVGFGSNAMVKGIHSSVLGGRDNAIMTGSVASVIVGGATNMIDTNQIYSFIGGGQDNRIQPYTAAAGQVGYNTIGGGKNNQILGTNVNSTIAGGASGSIQNARDAFIGGGGSAIVGCDGRYGVVVGGLNNRVGFAGSATIEVSKGSAIVGGEQNIVRGLYGFVGGGFQNIFLGTTEPGCDYGVIGGGQGNALGLAGSRVTHASIIGGSANGIQNNAHYSVIAGGRENLVLGNSTNSFIGGGYNNLVNANAPFGSILAGLDNTITATGDNGTIIGYSNQVSAIGGIAIGRNVTNDRSAVFFGSWDTKHRVAVAGPSNSWLGGVIWKEAATLYTNLNGVPGTLTNLASVSIPANQLTNNGDSLIAEWGIKLQNAKENTNRFQLIYGSQTLLDTGLQIASNASVRAGCTITRTGNTSQHVEAWLHWGPAVVPFAFTNVNIEIAQTNGIATVLKAMGSAQAVGAHTNNFFKVKWEPASQ